MECKPVNTCLHVTLYEDRVWNVLAQVPEMDQLTLDLLVSALLL